MNLQLYLKWIYIFSITTSCSGQNNKKVDQMEETEISILKNALDNNQYELKSDKVFNDKISNYLGIDTNSLSNE